MKVTNSVNKVAALHCFINEHKNTAFKWGQYDCCLFVANYLLLVTGVDFASDFRGKYNSKLSAFKFLKKRGFTDLHSVFKQRLKGVQTQFASRGDIALVLNENELIAGIVGLNCVYCVGDDGLKTVSMAHVKHVYRAEAA